MPWLFLDSRFVLLGINLGGIRKEHAKEMAKM